MLSHASSTSTTLLAQELSIGNPVPLSTTEIADLVADKTVQQFGFMMYFDPEGTCQMTSLRAEHGGPTARLADCIWWVEMPNNLCAHMKGLNGAVREGCVESLNCGDAIGAELDGVPVCLVNSFHFTPGNQIPSPE